MYSDLIGKPFDDNGTGPDKYNCWHLAKEVFKRHGIELKDYRISAYDKLTINSAYESDRCEWKTVQGEPPVPSMVTIRNNSPYINHFGVYIGNGRFIHALRGAGVCISRVDDPRWSSKIVEYLMPKEVK